MRGERNFGGGVSEGREKFWVRKGERNQEKKTTFRLWDCFKNNYIDCALN